MEMASSAEQLGQCTSYRESSERYVPHDQSLEALHDDGCECDEMIVIEAKKMVVVLKHIGMAVVLREILKLSVRTSTCCSHAQSTWSLGVGLSSSLPCCFEPVPCSKLRSRSFSSGQSSMSSEAGCHKMAMSR